MEHGRKKVLIFGLDGGTWTVLGPALAQGRMPYLQSLVDRGASGVLESTIPAITPAAWGSFQTGRNPGANGVFDFSYWDRHARRQRFVNARSLERTLWQRVSDAGYRVGAINVPVTYPPSPVRGFIVAGILSPSLESGFTYPPELRRHLLEAVPDYHVFQLEKFAGNARAVEDLRAFVESMGSIIDVRARAARFLIDRERPDFLMVHFQTSDVLQHMAWQLLDPQCPEFDASKREYLFEHFYRRLDGHMETLQRQFFDGSAEALTLVVSDHGFERHEKRFNLGNWLVEEDFLRVNSRAFRTPGFKRLTGALRLGRWMGYLLGRRAVSRIESGLASRPYPFLWEGTRAFSVGRSGEGFIYLLESDEARRRETAQRIADRLAAVTDPENGRRVVARVHRKEDLFHGGYMDRMPDLIVEGGSGYSFTGKYQHGRELFHTVRPRTDLHVGKHHPDGILVAAGEGIRRAEALRARLVDIVPTLLGWLGLPGDASLDGRVVREMLTDEVLASSPMEDGMVPGPGAAGTPGEYTEQDEQAIEQRLRDLGYME